MKTSTLQSKKQNAIFSCLKQYLSHEQLMQAMLLWEDKYAEQPGFAVRYFANDVVKIANNAVKSKELVTQMVVALNARDTQNEDAAPFVESYRLKHGLIPSAPIASPEVSALNVLLAKLVDLTEPNMRKEVCTAIYKRLAKTNIASNFKIQLMRWLESNTYPMRPTKAEISDLRVALSTAYAGYCETLGPVKADAILADALRRLESNGGAIYTHIYKQIL